MNDEEDRLPGSSFIVHRSSFSERLLALYDALDQHFAHEPHWWPIVSATPQLEMIVGSVLVQQTRWETVEAAVLRLRNAQLLDPAALAAADTARLAELIRPCAFHSQKAPGLQAIGRFIAERYDGDVRALLAQERAPLRAELLALPRVGRETADTIMLYAGGHPLFIVDAYARRLLERFGVLPGFDFMRARYDDVQALVEAALAGLLADGKLPPARANRPHENAQAAHCAFYRDLHALIVEACIHHCLANAPRCDRAGARRRFVDPRKCAEHCLSCLSCPLQLSCLSYQAAQQKAPAYA